MEGVLRATEINFKYGSLIRGGPKNVTSGKWDATHVRNHDDAGPVRLLRLYFSKLNPASGKTGLYGDKMTSRPYLEEEDPKWAAGEFERYTKSLVSRAHHFWNGVFWLKTPEKYDDLNWPDGKPTHRCNLYCRFELEQVYSEGDAHYTIAVVRALDNADSRSNSKLYSQKDISTEGLIPRSTTKFWTHFHEVGHLLGLGPSAMTGIPTCTPIIRQARTASLKQRWRKGSIRRLWRALPWQTAAENLTKIRKDDWKVHCTVCIRRP